MKLQKRKQNYRNKEITETYFKLQTNNMTGFFGVLLEESNRAVVPFCTRNISALISGVTHEVIFL